MAYTVWHKTATIRRELCDALRDQPPQVRAQRARMIREINAELRYY